MRTILAILLLSASVAFAGRYSVVFFESTVSQEGMNLALENIRDMGGDTNIINSADMPVWRRKSDTNYTGKIVSIRTDNLGVNGWKDKPLPQIETVIVSGLSNPDKQNVRVFNIEDFKELHEVQP